MSELPLIPGHRDGAALLVFLTPSNQQQQDMIVQQMTSYNWCVQAGGGNLASASGLPPLVWKPWTRDAEGTRQDAYLLSKQAREAGWDHVFFVTGGTLAMSKPWPMTRQVYIVLAFWREQTIRAFRVEMKSSPGIVPQPVALLQAVRANQDKEKISELGRNANSEILKDADGEIPGFDTGNNCSSEQQTRLDQLNFDSDRIIIFDTASSDSINEKARKNWETLTGHTVEWRSWYHDHPPTRSDLFSFIEKAREANGSPYSFLIFWANSNSLESAVLYGALFHKDLTTHAQQVRWAQLPFSNASKLWKVALKNPMDILAQFSSFGWTKVIRAPYEPVCKRNLMQVSREYQDENDFHAYVVWATTRLTLTERSTLSVELATEAPWMMKPKDGRDELEDGLKSSPEYPDLHRRKAHILVPWEPSTPMSRAAMLHIYRTVESLTGGSCGTIFADRQSPSDLKVLLTRWKEEEDMQEEDHEPYNEMSPEVRYAEGMLYGRVDGRDAKESWVNLWVGGVGFDEMVQPKDMLIVTEGMSDEDETSDEDDMSDEDE